MGKFEATINFYQGRLVIPTWFEERSKGLLFGIGRSYSRLPSSSLLLRISIMDKTLLLLLGLTASHFDLSNVGGI